MNDIEKLLAIEEIKRLKAKYCRVMDEKNWQEWRNVFTPDGVMLVPEVKERPAIIGVDAIIEFIIPLLDTAVTVHHLHAPEIEILSDTEATGIWALDDNLWWTPEAPSTYGWTKLRGAGHYREKYRKTEHGWRIAELALTRLYLERG
jgi:hypothetical protein